MISEEVWNEMLEQCCDGNYDRQSCDFHSPQTTACKNAVDIANANCCNGINVYNIYGDCVTESNRQELDESNQLYPLDKLLTMLQYNNINIGNIGGILS